jgi:hypothetical protein
MAMTSGAETGPPVVESTTVSSSPISRYVRQPFEQPVANTKRAASETDKGTQSFRKNV